MEGTKKYTKRKKQGVNNKKTANLLIDEEDGVKHCICKSRDYTTLMVCCDYCSVWYHVKCMGVTKVEVERIEKYACKICTKKDSKCRTVYKKGPKSKKELAKKNKKKQKEMKKEVRKKGAMNKAEKKMKKAENRKETCESDAANAKKQEKIEPDEEVINCKCDMDESIATNNQKEVEEIFLKSFAELTSQQQQQLEIHETHPELRCRNCIGCFRENDCNNCVTCIQGEGKCCMDRICVQIEELLKQKMKGKDDVIVHCQKIKKGRTPKQIICGFKETKTVMRQKKRHVKEVHHDDASLNAHLNKLYCNWMRNRSKNKPLQLQEAIQCFGPGCTNSSRIGSRYCSETCGMALAQERLNMLLPQRANAFFANKPVGQSSDNQRMQNLEEQITGVKSKLDELEQWKDNMHQLIMAVKDTHPSAQKQHNDDDNLVVGCPICQGEFSVRECGRHIQSCFVRSERQTTYGTDYQIPNNQYNLYCEAYNKINRTYCKRLRYACSEHYKDEYDLKVCGCPLNWYQGGSFRFHELLSLPPNEIIDLKGFCQEKQRNCRVHNNWVQTAFSLIDNERMNLLNKLDELFEQQRFLQNTLVQRGNVVSLIYNKITQTG